LPRRAAAPGGAPNVVLIMVDTLRADHLSCYGSTAVKTPHIDALAADGTRWANAFAQASWTRPSVATILTGLYPSSHGAVHKADRLPERVDTLAERLRAIGYRTVGFADNANISRAFNFQQGFDEYRYLEPDFFFGASEPASQLALYSGLRLVRERFLAHYVDVHLGVLFDDFRRRGLYDQTLVVLTADHGEEFHEHGGWWHGTTLYDEQIHVPLIVKPPGAHGPGPAGGAGRVLDELATSLDIAPTILAAAGLKVPKTLPGHALPLDGGAAPARESTFAEEDLEGNV